MLRKLVIIGIVLIISSATNAQEYKKWDSHDIVRYYEKKQITLKENEYIDLDNNVLNEDGETFSENRINYDDTSYGKLTYISCYNPTPGKKQNVFLMRLLQEVL
jgi:disulfide oxidoreductase YuzD